MSVRKERGLKITHRVVTEASVYQSSVTFSKDDKKFLKRVCPDAAFIENLTVVLSSAEAAVALPDKFSLEEHKDYLADLEKTARRLLTLLELKATPRPGINTTTASDAIVGGTLREAGAQAWREFWLTGDPRKLPKPLPVALPPKIEQWRQSIKELLSHLPNARERQKTRYRRSRTDARLWCIVEVLQRVFRHHGLPFAGTKSKFEQCLAIILETAGRPMKEEAIRRMVIKARKKFQQFPSKFYPPLEVDFIPIPSVKVKPKTFR